MSEPIYRPGLEGVVAGETAISTIAGGLQYRGYSIEDLAANATFEEVAYLILRGELPNAEELAAMRLRLGKGSAAAVRCAPVRGGLHKESTMEEIKQRLNDLEMRFTYQEELIEELNEVVTSCNLQVQRLSRENSRLHEMVRGLAPEMSESPDE